MTIQSARDLISLELQHIEDAEKQAAQALQRMAKQVEMPRLRQMLDQRLKQGERILRDVQRSLEKLDGGGQPSQNAAARGIIQETERILREVRPPEMKQAAMIAGVQKLEHYCIATWGTVKALAHEMGEQELAQAMERALDKGYGYDREMTELAEGRVNPRGAGSRTTSRRPGGARRTNGSRFERFVNFAKIALSQIGSHLLGGGRNAGNGSDAFGNGAVSPIA